MRKLNINNQVVTIDELLEGYRIGSKPSSNVAFFGDNGTDVFVQFKNGKSYIYQSVRKELIKQLNTVESIGRFISVLSKECKYVPIERELVKPVAAEAISSR